MADGRGFPSSLCNCSAKKGTHVHCQCKNCNGRPVVRRTQLNHLRLESEMEQMSGNSTPSAPTENRVEMESSGSGIHEHTLSDQDVCDVDVSIHTFESLNYVEHLTRETLTNAGQLPDDSADEDVDDEDIDDQDGIQGVDITKDAIVHAIFQSLDCLDKMNGSLNNFGELLSLARTLYCKGAQVDPLDEDIIKEWPKTWNDAKKLLVDMGYTDAKEYFICLSGVHPCHWDILESKTDVCRHCGNNPTIPYYYLGLEAKVKLWVSSKSMCHKMTAHWREKDHWLGRNEGWPIKRELWDGDRFAELSWFFDRESQWCLPVRCKMQGCKNVISGDIVESLPELPNAMKGVTCDECHHSFTFKPKYARGDPRNIALIGHWDGFQPFGSSSRSAMEVMIATMSKLDRASAEEVYTFGFVPSHLLPDRRPNSLDPFLDPLVTDLERGFIEGIQVSYKGEIPLYPPGEITVRLLLLLWTGDHPAQCEVCKSKGAGGKNACRRCKLKAQYMEAQKHYYYPGFRKNYRFPIDRRQLAEEVPVMDEIGQEERVTVAEARSKESGFLGVSQLHRLHKLYKFDVLKDLVFDIMHLVPLNLVKRRLEHLLSNSLVNKEQMQASLKVIPWTKEYRQSRLPSDISEVGRWKAEEWQKFAYPASEYVMEAILSPNDKEVWASLPRIVEYIFNSGLNGWTRDMVNDFTRLCWRYCILVEESYGITECLITLHTLTHVPDDIMRFSTPDNYWCFQYERAVGRYVKQTSNKKGIEKTFARKESQREFIKTWVHNNKLRVTATTQTGKHNQEKMVATSLQAAMNLLKLCKAGEDDAARAITGVLIGKGDIHILSREEKLSTTACLARCGFGVDVDVYMAEEYRSAFREENGFAPASGTHYQIGDVAIANEDNGVIVKISHFYLLEVQQQFIPLLIGDSYKVSKDIDNNDLRHPFSDTAIVEPCETNSCICLRNLMRKIMLHPYHAGQFAIIDPSRTHTPLPEVLVPVLPQVGDMVFVKGDEEELWRAEIRVVDQDVNVAQGYFFVKHRHWQHNSLWVRESQGRALDRIMFQSIVGIVNGQWYGAGWKDVAG